MNYYYITFRSITFAQRAERLLSRGNVSCILQRTPKWMEEQGCGYALRVRTLEIRSQVQLLRQNRIPLRRVYLQTGEGQFEEIPL